MGCKLNAKKRVVIFDCPQCGSLLNCPYDEAGTRQQCPTCFGFLVVPGVAEVAEAKRLETERAEIESKLHQAEAERRFKQTAALKQVEREAAENYDTRTAAPPKSVAPSMAPTAMAQVARPMSGSKLFVIVTVAVAAGLTLAFVVYAMFFAAVGGAGRGASATLGEWEQALVKAIEGGNVEMTREALTRSLNWKEVATPALKALLNNSQLREYYESVKEREFWNAVAERLVKNGADVNECISVVAIQGSSLKFLLDHGANVNYQPYPRAATPLHWQCNDLYAENVTLLVSRGANVNAVGPDGNTPLHEAAKNNAVDVISQLLAKGAAINATNAQGQTPLNVADLAIQKEAAALLRSKGGK